MINLGISKHEIGEIYGINKLIDLYRGNNNRKMATVTCMLCGKIKNIYEEYLDYPKYTSCACQLTKHGDYKTKLYGVYHNMKYRCYNKNMKEFHNYGGKGIRMCDEWLGENGYSNFKKWAFENGYKEGLTIDRIDSNGNYCPDNCQWISKGENTAKSNAIIQHRFANNGRYYAIDKNEKYYEFDNASKFAREHNLNACMVRKSANNNKQYMAWTFGFVKDLKDKDEEKNEV